MPIVGLNLTSIKASINEEAAKSEINVNSSPLIKSVEKKNIGLSGMDEIAIIGFSFVTSYEPKIGEIVIEGDLLYQTGDPKKLVKKWKDEKKLEKDVAIEVLNAIFRRCLVKATEISYDLRLPPPVRFPVIKAEDEEKNQYVG